MHGALGEPYDEAIRYYGPPNGTFDPEWATRLLLSRRPDLGWSLAYLLVSAAWRHLRASPQLSPQELASYCALDAPTAADADIAAAVDAALDFCDAYEVEPPRL